MSDGFDCLGVDDEIGFDYGGLLQAAGGVAQYGISAAEQEKKDKESAADQKKKLNDAIAADIAASNAVAKADTSTQLKSASAGIDTTAAQMALTTQDRAGAAGLSDESSKKRAEAADASLANAVKNAQNKPKDGYAQALVRAWQVTANKAHSTAIVASGSGFAGYGGESWISKKVWGPIPGWGVLTIAAGALGAVVVVLKKFVFAKVGG